MREIDLTRIQTLIVGMVEETERNRHVSNLCQKLGLNSGLSASVACNPGFFGCTLGHLRALWYAREKGALPLLVLENDCSATDRFRPSVQVPDDTDIFYLGNSSCGIVPELRNRGIRGCVLVSRYEDRDDLYRTDNMTATHAILYVSSAGLDAAIDAAVAALAHAIPIDIKYVTDLQSRLNVYNSRYPWFYQDAALQGKREIAGLMQTITLNEVPRPRNAGDGFEYITSLESGSPERIWLTAEENVPGARPPLFWRVASRSRVDPAEPGK